MFRVVESRTHHPWDRCGGVLNTCLRMGVHGLPLVSDGRFVIPEESSGHTFIQGVCQVASDKMSSDLTKYLSKCTVAKLPSHDIAAERTEVKSTS